jgi:hypothetical protein
MCAEWQSLFLNLHHRSDDHISLKRTRESASNQVIIGTEEDPATDKSLLSLNSMVKQIFPVSEVLCCLYYLEESSFL